MLDNLLNMVGLQRKPTMDPAALQGDADPAIAAPDVLPLDVGQWRPRIESSKQFVSDRITKAKENVKRYRMKHYAGSAALTSDSIQVPVDFWNVEQKRAQLFYRVPEIVLTGLTPDSAPVAPFFQDILNEQLGPNHLHIKTLMDELIFDVLCPTGYAAAKFGYESYVGDQGMPTGGCYYADRIPPGRLRGPFNEFTESDFDQCDWLGMRFYEAVDDGTQGATTYVDRDDDLLVEDAQQSRGKTSRTVKWGTYVCYRLSKFDTTVTDPRIIREFELMDGEDDPRLHRNLECPNFKGFPIKVLTIRYVSDLCFPPSDCDITRVLADEVSRGRSQALVHRNRSLPQNMYDSTAMRQSTLDKIERGDSNGMIGHPGPITDQLIRQINKGEIPQESYRFNDVVERDIERSWGMGANQQGQTTDTQRTATELQIMENAKDTRLDYERDKIIDWFCNKAVRSLAALLQHYAEQDATIMSTDPQGGQTFEQWNKAHIQGEFTFSIKINSQLRPDSAAQQKKMLDWVNISAKSPFINQSENWSLLAKEWGFDPSKIIVQPPPPKPEPPPPLSLKGEDLSPMNPQYPAVYQIMQQFYGITLPVPPQLAVAAQAAMGTDNPTTPGTAPKADVLSKHNADETGRLTGGGSVVQQLTGRGVM